MNKNVSLISHAKRDSGPRYTLQYIYLSVYVSVPKFMHLVNCFPNQGVQEADRPDDGFYIRSGITIIMEKATIGDGTVI